MCNKNIILAIIRLMTIEYTKRENNKIKLKIMIKSENVILQPNTVL